LVYTGDVLRVSPFVSQTQQALSGKDDAVDKEIERLLAREREKSHDLRV
jgi:hypothetical protein